MNSISDSERLKRSQNNVCLTGSGWIRKTLVITFCILIVISFAVPVLGEPPKSKKVIFEVEPEPVVNTVPTIMYGPISAPRSSGFTIAGVADIAVDAEVEVGETVDFPIGSGSIGLFTTTDDNLLTGVYMVECYGGGMQTHSGYYYRLKLTNSTNEIYYPSSTTTAFSFTGCGCNPPANPMVVAQAQDRPTGTPQNDFLITWMVEISPGFNTWPLVLIGSPFAAFSGNSLQNPIGGGGGYQIQPGDRHLFGAWGMWDDGTGMAFWHNESSDGIYDSVPAPFAAVKTEKNVSIKTNLTLYNGRNYITFTSVLNTGWYASSLLIEIKTQLNILYGENLEYDDLELTRYRGTYTTCYWWMNYQYTWNFQLQEGVCYILDILNNKLDNQPLQYQLPNYQITSPRIIDLYNGMNYRGFPVTTNSTMASELLEEVVAEINTDYGEDLTNYDITITQYSGSFKTCFWFLGIMWLNDFPLDPQSGYIVVIWNSKLDVQPVQFTP